MPPCASRVTSPSTSGDAFTSTLAWTDGSDSRYTDTQKDSDETVLSWPRKKGNGLGFANFIGEYRTHCNVLDHSLQIMLISMDSDNFGSEFGGLGSPSNR